MAARPSAAGSARRSEPTLASGWRPSRSSRNAAIPSARAPSMSSSYESPTIAAREARRRAARGRRGRSTGAASCGRTRPSRLRRRRRSRDGRRTRSRSRCPFETSPSLSPCRRSSASAGRTSSYSVKCSCRSHAATISAAHARRALAVAAHAADDVLREQHPQLLVVLELRVPPQVVQRRQPRLLVAAGIEAEAVPLAEPPVPLRPELRPRSRQREVDVEEHGLEHAAEDSRGRFALPCRPPRGVAQPGSALRSGRRGPQFKSGHPDWSAGEPPGSPATRPSRPCARFGTKTTRTRARSPATVDP